MTFLCSCTLLLLILVFVHWRPVTTNDKKKKTEMNTIHVPAPKHNMNSIPSLLAGVVGRLDNAVHNVTGD